MLLRNVKKTRRLEKLHKELEGKTFLPNRFVFLIIKSLNGNSFVILN